MKHKFHKLIPAIEDELATRRGLFDDLMAYKQRLHELPFGSRDRELFQEAVKETYERLYDIDARLYAIETLLFVQ